MDAITLLAPIGAIAAKRVTSEGVLPAPHVELHRCAVAQVGSFAELARLLTHLATDPAYYVVRGAPLPSANPIAMRRAHVTDPTLEEVPRRWLLIDLDSWRPEVDARAFAADPATYARDARSALPPCFHGVAAFWQATASAGVKPGVRLRLAFWLDRALSSAEVSAWAKTWPIAVDTSLYNASQPHYTANPLFDGVADPVATRTGTLDGAPAVELPVVLVEGRATEAQAALEAAARKVARLEEGQRYLKLNAIAFNLARRFGEDDLPADAIKSALEKACAKSGLPGEEIRRGVTCAVRDGRAKHETEHAGWRDLLSRDKDDQPRSTQANVTLFLEHHAAFKGRIGLNERTQAEVWIRSPDWAQRDRGAIINAGDVAKIVEWFQEHAKIDAREGWVRSGLGKAAAAYPYDAVQDYLNGLPTWDGAQRLPTVFVRHLGAEDSELVRTMTAMWFVQAARRAFATLAHPVKADYMVLLIGPQGLGKSTVLERLCVGGYFRPDLPDLASKDARQALADTWILELAEFTQRKADRDSFKAFTSATVDKYRPPYGRDEVRVARRCVIAITTNDTEPLQDTTGNRRFWPIVCTRAADFEAVTAERDQIWAEAMHYARAGLPPGLPVHLLEQARDAQEAHRDEIVIADTFRALAAGSAPGYGIAYEEGQLAAGRVRYLRAVQACAIANVRPQDHRGVATVKDALRDAGWRERRVKEAGQWRRAWYPPESSNANAVKITEAN